MIAISLASVWQEFSSQKEGWLLFPMDVLKKA